jgi:O-antigen ligase
MEAVKAQRDRSVAFVSEQLFRLVVQISGVAAIITGCAMHTDPWLGFATAATFLVAMLGARWHMASTTAVVLFLAYIEAGILVAVAPRIAGTPLWLAAMAGLVAGGTSWTRWTSPRSWRWPLMLWLLGVALSWPIIAGREMDFSLVAPRSGVGNVLLAAVATLSAGLWLDTLLTWDSENIVRRVARPLLAGAVISACAAIYQGVVDITWLSAPPWSTTDRAIGLMGDANPMAVVAATWAPLAIALTGPRMLRAVGAVLAVMLWYAAWLTGARSALLLFGTGAAGLLLGALTTRVGTRRAFLISLCVLAIGAAGVALAAASTRTGPVARLVASLPLDDPKGLAYEALWRRDGYGLAAIRAIREQPWTGVGVGAFSDLSSYYHRLETNARLPADNAQNFWRHMVAERGVLALPAVVMMTLVTVQLLLAAPRTAALPVWVLKGAVTGLGLVSVFGMPTQNATLSVTAASLIAWLYAHVVEERDVRSMTTLKPAAIIAVWLLAVGGATVDALMARQVLRPAWRAVRVGDLYTYGFGEPAIGADGSRGRPVVGRAVASVPAMGTPYDLRYWSRDDTANRLRVWQDHVLVIDDVVQPGAVVHRVLYASPGRPGMLLEFESVRDAVVVSGDFRR